MAWDIKSRFGLAAILTLAGLLYLKLFSFWAYRDELRHLSHMVRLSSPRDFVGIPPWIRPLEVLVNYANTRVFGYEVMHLSHFVSFSAFLVSISLVFVLACRMANRALPAAILAAAFFAFHPVNVSAVYRIDTISQMLVALISLSYLYWLVSRPSLATMSAFLGGCAFTILLLLSKETSLGLILGVPIAAALVRFFSAEQGSPAQSADLRAIGRLLIGALSLLVAYAALRHAYIMSVLGPTGTRYEVNFSVFNMLKNSALSLASLMYLGDSVELFLNRSRGAIVVTAILSAGVLFLSVLGAVSIVRGSDRMAQVWAGALVLMIAAAQFPAVLIQKVNELYSIGPSPYFSLLISLLGWNGYLFLRHRTRKAGMLIPVSLVALLGWMGVAVAAKLAYAEEENRRARVMYAKLDESIVAARTGGVVCIEAFSPTYTQSYNMLISPDEDLMHSVMLYVAAQQALPLSLELDQSSAGCRYKVSVKR